MDDLIKQLRVHHDSEYSQKVCEEAAARIEELEAAWKDSIDGVERIAFNIEPPNEHTPRLIMWVNQMRNEMTRITTGG